MKEKIVCVEWDDASYISGYYDKKNPEDFEPTFTKSIGHLVKKTLRAVIISQDRFYDSKGKIESDRHIGIIPKKMIRRITELK